MSSPKIPAQDDSSNEPVLEAIFVADFENGLVEAVRVRPWGNTSEMDLRPHGTRAAYRRHYRHGEKPCEACRQAQNRWWHDYYSETRRERRKQAS